MSTMVGWQGGVCLSDGEGCMTSCTNQPLGWARVPGDCMDANCTGDLIPGSRPFFSKWRSTLHDRKITLVCDKALK